MTGQDRGGGPDAGVGPAHRSPAALALVFVGGVAGTGCRFLADEAIRPWGAWPASTFLVNVLGALLLGALWALLPGAGSRWRPLAGTGFLGAFTTYSALAVQADLLLRDGMAPLAVGYAAGSVLAGLAAAAVGTLVGSRIRSGPSA
jgi:CrcB protein